MDFLDIFWKSVSSIAIFLRKQKQFAPAFSVLRDYFCFWAHIPLPTPRETLATLHTTLRICLPLVTWGHQWRTGKKDENWVVGKNLGFISCLEEGFWHMPSCGLMEAASNGRFLEDDSNAWWSHISVFFKWLIYRVVFFCCL